MPRPPRSQPVLSYEDKAHRRALGNRLRELRGSRTQEAVADAALVAREYLSKVESGHRNPSFDVLVRLARALNVSLEVLFKGM